MGVDLGNAMNRKKLTQNSADFAALAGADGLPTTRTTTIQLVADWLNKNQPVSDGDRQLQPGRRPDDHRRHAHRQQPERRGHLPGPTASRSLAPAARIQYGLANVIGFDDACVQSTATARIASSGIGMAPYYTTTACASGQQTIKDNSGGLSLPFTVPPLFARCRDEQRGARHQRHHPTADPACRGRRPRRPERHHHRHQSWVPRTSTRSASSAPTRPRPRSPPSRPRPTHRSPSTSPTPWRPTRTSGTSECTAWRPSPLPSNADKWSARTQALPLQVGEGVLSCDVGSSSGNFGSIDIPWGGNDHDDLDQEHQQGPVLRRPSTPTRRPAGRQPVPEPDRRRALISTDTLSMPNTYCVQR